MRHLKHRHELGVKKAHRIALMANLACALIREGRIKTTLAKAKALRPFTEKLISLAKRGNVADRRLANSRLRNKEALQILFNEKVEEFQDRQGGYTRIYKIGTRVGDAAEMAIIELIPAADEGYGKKKKKKTKKAAKKKVAAPSEKKSEEALAEVFETAETEQSVEEAEGAEVNEKAEEKPPDAPEEKAEEQAKATSEDAEGLEDDSKK